MLLSRCGTLLPVTLLLLSWSISLQVVEAVDLKSAEESPCFKITKTVPMDPLWLMKQKIWYYPLMSRMDLYSGALHLTGKNANELSEDELYYESCPKFKMVGGALSAIGFNGIKKNYSMKPVKGLEVFEMNDDGGKLWGTAHTVLTDNKTFGVVAFCLANDQMAWGTMSTQKTLPQETVKQIHDHMESLGFKREYFTGIRYDSCNKKDKKTKNEL